jgi:predicted DNA-binding protein (UPF0251 family)
MWRQRHRHGRRGRFPKPITIGVVSPVNSLTPNPAGNLEPVMIDVAELEASRLVDLEGLSQEEAGQKMRVSRGTVWRLVQSARKKTALALTQGRPIQITSYAPDTNTVPP